MLSLSHCQRIFMARAATDMRKGAHGLAQMVCDHLDQDPLSGDVFMFFSRRRNYVKILMWDTSGYWLACKRLEKGVYALGDRQGDRSSKGSHPLSVAEAMNILEGIHVKQAAYHQHYSLPPGNMSEK